MTPSQLCERISTDCKALAHFLIDENEIPTAIEVLESLAKFSHTHFIQNHESTVYDCVNKRLGSIEADDD